MVIDPATDVPADRFQAGSVVHLDDGTPLTVTRYEATDRSPLVTFAEIGDRPAAELLRGRDLFIPRSSRRPLERDEYWPDDLVGLVVTGRDGQVVGTVTAVHTGLAQDRLILEAPHGEVIVPLVAPLVQKVDLAGGTILVDLPAGFIE